MSDNTINESAARLLSALTPINRTPAQGDLLAALKDYFEETIDDARTLTHTHTGTTEQEHYTRRLAQLTHIYDLAKKGLLFLPAPRLLTDKRIY